MTHFTFTWHSSRLNYTLHDYMTHIPLIGHNTRSHGTAHAKMTQFTIYYFFLSIAQSIMCFSCGFSESNEANSTSSCEANSEIKDCSLHPDFGDDYDSCFSQVVVVRGKAKIHIKECAMSWGCEELEQILCEGNSVEDSENSSPENCRVECCMEDYCNENILNDSSAFKEINLMSSSSTVKTILLSSCLAVFHALCLLTL